MIRVDYILQNLVISVLVQRSDQRGSSMVVEKSVEGQEPSKNPIVYVEHPRKQGPIVGQSVEKEQTWALVVCSI